MVLRHTHTIQNTFFEHIRKKPQKMIGGFSLLLETSENKNFKESIEPMEKVRIVKLDSSNYLAFPKEMGAVIKKVGLSQDFYYQFTEFGWVSNRLNPHTKPINYSNIISLIENDPFVVFIDSFFDYDFSVIFSKISDLDFITKRIRNDLLLIPKSYGATAVVKSNSNVSIKALTLTKTGIKLLGKSSDPVKDLGFLHKNQIVDIIGKYKLLTSNDEEFKIYPESENVIALLKDGLNVNMNAWNYSRNGWHLTNVY